MYDNTAAKNGEIAAKTDVMLKYGSGFDGAAGRTQCAPFAGKVTDLVSRKVQRRRVIERARLATGQVHQALGSIREKEIIVSTC
jgi:hypothetical protein